MFPSERFLAQIGKHRKPNRTEPIDKQIAIIRRSFTEMNGHLPSNLVDGILNHFAADLAEGPGETAFDRCEILGDVLDVLHEQYDEEHDPLDSPSWSVIAGIVSDLALDLDMDFVTYVMKLAVDHRAV